MNLLLDTHVLLWWLDDNPILLIKAKEAIADGRNMVFVSAAAIDHALSLENSRRIIEISFDRMLIAQALFEGFTLVTRDSRFKRYKVSTIRA